MHFRAHPPVVFCRNILEFWRLELKHAEGMSLRFVPVC